MSTFYATFGNQSQARLMVQELLASGIRPDDICLAILQPEGRQTGEIREEIASVGDATEYVGRPDDPDRDQVDYPLLSELTATHEATWQAGISTADTGRNVDSVDQHDDSQYASEDMIDPPLAISQSEHELDDLAMTVRTGYPTSVPVIDNDFDSGAEADQSTFSLQTIEIPGGGSVAGMGAMSAAALEAVRADGESNPSSIGEYLRDKGAVEGVARRLCDEFLSGHALIEVALTPGEVDEPAIEQIASRYGASTVQMLDAPRFYENGGGMSEDEKGYVL